MSRYRQNTPDDYLTLTRTSAARASGAAIGVALVFDSTNAYLYSDGDRVLVESFAEMPGREKVSTYAGEISPATVQVAANRAITVPNLCLAKVRHKGIPPTPARTLCR